MARTATSNLAAIAAATADRAAPLSTGVEMDRALRELAELAVRFPFRWFPQIKVARICGFGPDVMTALAAHGAPILARKCNPHLLHKWLEENVRAIGKIRAAEKSISHRPQFPTGRRGGVRSREM